MSLPIPPLPKSAAINASGHLEISGCDVIELAAEFGTPLFIYDEGQIRERCRAYQSAFAACTDDFEAIYASKAFTCLAMSQLVAEEGFSLDVASGGELYTALAGGFPAERIFLHGNANSESELDQALRAGVGHVVVDSLDEMRQLNEVAGRHGRRQPVLLRITPGIEAHTHDFIQTGKLDSKFGFCLAEGVALEAVGEALEADHLELTGLHVHIGSQIFSLEPYRQTITIMADFMAECRERFGFECRLLDLGGGLGVAYSPADAPAVVDELARLMVEGLREEMRRTGLPMPRLAVEPGRSIVANAGLTAYTVQTVKTIPGVRTYVAVDGGMSDNLRPMLYGSRYETLIADRPTAPPTATVAVAGKHCESGDIIARETALPDPRPGDIIVTPSTGAYGYSMASNYNGQLRPAVIFVKDGHPRVIIRRESHEDLIRLHEPLG